MDKNYLQSLTDKQHTINTLSMWCTDERERNYSKTCVKWLLSKKQQIDFQDPLSLNTGQKYCRMLHREHSAILLTYIKLHRFYCTQNLSSAGVMISTIIVVTVNSDIFAIIIFREYH